MDSDETTARLWTPWRMRYVGGAAREDGCIFCNRLAEGDDVRTLILHRGPHAFVILNFYPYNTGHVMIVPNLHIATPEDADAATTAEMAALRTPVLRALRRALDPAGFNLGLNVGDVAGAGVTGHLHEHVVPRWKGDANFMPILASTMVMPELLPVTYAKVRAEMERETRGEIVAKVVVVSPDEQWLLLDEGKLPRVQLQDDVPAWRTAHQEIRARGVGDPALLGWAGRERAGTGPIALLFRAETAEDCPPPSAVPISDIDRVLSPTEAELVRTALARVA
jgi:ATP adenylyltransferase